MQITQNSLETILPHWKDDHSASTDLWLMWSLFTNVWVIFLSLRQSDYWWNWYGNGKNRATNKEWGVALWQKTWNACKVRGSLHLPHQTLSNRLLHWSHNKGQKFLLIKRLFGPFATLGAEWIWTNPGRGYTSYCASPSFQTEKIRCFQCPEIVKPIL